MAGSPCGNRSPIHGYGALQNSSGSNWSLQRKSSFENQLGALAFGTSPNQMEGPIVFVAPELTQETLLEVCLIFFFLIDTFSYSLPFFLTVEGT